MSGVYSPTSRGHGAASDGPRRRSSKLSDVSAIRRHPGGVRGERHQDTRAGRTTQTVGSDHPTKTPSVRMAPPNGSSENPAGSPDGVTFFPGYTFSRLA